MPDQTAAISGRRIAVTGATGLIGSEIRRRLEQAGHQTIQLTRRPPTSTVTQAQWSVDEGLVNPSRLEGIHGVIHLAGESIVGRWTEDKKRRIRDSRVDGTRKLCEDLARLRSKPAVLLCASGINYYGDRGDEVLDEYTQPGRGFLSDVCQQWEAATSPAAQAGIRVVNVRTGVVMSQKGGALQKMLLPFRTGVGGRIGNGQQYWSWISLDDVVGAYLKALSNDSISGPLNATSPNPVTNAEFTRVLGEVLHRPTILPLPGFAARIVLGEMADELLLASARVQPRVLETNGYTFAYPDLRACLEHELHGNSSG
jgi:uncharacterized protein